MRLPFKRSMIAGGVVLALLLPACSSSIGDEPVAAPEVGPVGPAEQGGQQDSASLIGGGEAERVVFDPEEPFGVPTPTAAEVRVIRDGRIDLRVEPGLFGQVSGQVRTIAADLGGYVSSGESHLEAIDGERYAVGWFTVRVPEDRFEEAMSRAEDLGERIGLSVSSQEVTEEYVDLQGRLRYWEGQEAFFLDLMDNAKSTQELVSLQAQMQDILLTIEQIEGRLRYLDSRTEFSSLTVGLTEVPASTPIAAPDEPGIIADALEQAGTVLLSMVAFLIVAAAFVLPIGIVAAIGYGVWRGVSGGRKEAEPAEA